MLLHVVAHTLPGHPPLTEPSTAWWLMWRLRLAFPAALAACLMPNHPHLITPGNNVDEVRVRATRVLASLAARMGLKRMFECLPAPEPVRDRKHLLRQIRYVHLNPCRDNLAKDPMSWLWSTHRGLLGAEVEPWVSVERLAKALDRPVQGFASWLHRYVSSEPSVSVAGTEPPSSCGPRDIPAVPLDVVRRAALAATPWSSPWVRRKLFVELAVHQGWRDADLLARAAGLTARSVRRYMAGSRALSSDHPAVLCLGDARLLPPESLLFPIGPLPRAWDRSTAQHSCDGADGHRTHPSAPF